MCAFFELVGLNYVKQRFRSYEISEKKVLSTMTFSDLEKFLFKNFPQNQTLIEDSQFSMDAISVPVQITAIDGIY